MTEIVARLPRSRAFLPVLLVLAATAALATTAAIVLRPHPHAHPRTHARRTPPPAPVPDAAKPEAPPVPAARPLPTAELDAAAARAFGRTFFVDRGRGVEALAARVSRWRKLTAQAAKGSGIDPDLLSGMILVESSGNAGAIAGSRAGLTQLTPRAARRAGLRVNVRASRRSTREIGWWTRHGNRRVARRIARHRARVDRRFVPLAELRATVRTLEGARRVLGRTDLAIASYRLGISGLRRTVRRFGGSDVSYAQLYFGSAPDRHRTVYRRLRAHGEPAYDYLWHVLAARRLVRLYRGDPSELRWLDRQQHRKNSAEEVLHPRAVSHEFRTQAALARAWRRHQIVRIPRAASRTHIRVDRLGMNAPRHRRLYSGLRPGALDVLLRIGRRVHELAGGPPLRLTSAVRDDGYQRNLMVVNPFAARTYSLHTTGWTFDLGRATLTRRQERALRRVLDRLTAANLVASIEEPYCFHVTVASRAASERRLLRRAT